MEDLAGSMPGWMNGRSEAGCLDRLGSELGDAVDVDKGEQGSVKDRKWLLRVRSIYAS